MSEQFSVGEIAVTYGYQNPKFNGQEVTVLGPMEFDRSRYLEDDSHCGPQWLYPVRWLDGLKTWEPPHKLRKRRPPQEWEKLCHLTERPIEELA